MRGEGNLDVDRERCIGTDPCGFTASGASDVDTTGRVVVIGRAGASDEGVADAVEACTMSALTLRKREG
jgi:ferredoxin